MSVVGPVQPQRLLKLDMYLGVGQVLDGPDNVRDLHQVIVNHAGKMIGGEAGGFDDNRIADERILVADLALNDILNHRRARLFDPEADTAFSALCQ